WRHQMSDISSSPTVGLTQLNCVAQSDSRSQLVAGLRDQLNRWGSADAADETTFSCGAEAVDQLLPGGGLRLGVLIGWLSAGLAGGGQPAAKKRNTGSSFTAARGAATLGLLSAREACREGGVLVVIDRARTFYPPAAAAWGIDLERLIVVRPQNARDEL